MTVVDVDIMSGPAALASAGVLHSSYELGEHLHCLSMITAPKIYILQLLLLLLLLLFLFLFLFLSLHGL